MSDAQLSFRKSANIDRVTDKRKDSLFRLVDTDGSGTIDAQEFAVLYDAIKKDLAEELEKEAALAKEASSAKRRFKMLLLFVAVLVSFLAAPVAANFAVIFTVVDQAITTTTTSTGILEVKGSDTIAKTAVATQDLPLVIAPALDLETLAQVKSLTVKYRDALKHSVIEASVSIVSVRKHNATFVEFVTSDPSEMVQTLNGDASLVRYPTSTNGLSYVTKYSLCAANATCSAFRASGIDTDAAFELAKEELRNAGFSEVARRLDGWSTPYATKACSTGDYTLTPVCGYAYTPVTLGDSSGPVAGMWTKFSTNAHCFGAATNGFGGLNARPDWYSWFPWSVGPQFKPPPMGSLGVLSHTGYTGMRHLVFMLHGKGQRWTNMYALYCPTHEDMEMVTHSSNGGNTVVDPCPPLSFAPHLVYAFIGSGKLDGVFDPPWYIPGWSTDIFSSAYSNACDKLEPNIMTHIEEAAIEAGWDTSSSADGTMPYFDSFTEIMAIGFSDGAGAAVWMQYQGYFTSINKGITQVIALDYWAFNVYTTWLALPSTPGIMDTKIYTNCYSGVFKDGLGSKAIFPLTSSDQETLPLKSGYPATPDAASGADYTTYDWEMADGSCKKFSFWVHGLSSTGTSADWAPNSSFWTASCTNGQNMPVPVNGSIHWAVALFTVNSVLGDIADWVAAPASWDPNSPSSIPCYDSPSPPPPSPPPKPTKPKPKPKPEKPAVKPSYGWEKKYAKFWDTERGREEEFATAKMYAMGRRMEEEERQLSAGETMADVKAAVLFEEELMNTPIPPVMLKGRKPKYGKFEKFDFKMKGPPEREPPKKK